MSMSQREGLYNILDLVFSSEQNTVQDMPVSEPLATSDHNIISLSIVCDMEIVQWKKTYYDYRRANFKGMRNYLNGVK